MPTKHTISSLSVWLDKPAVQQAFTTLAATIIEAKVFAETYGEGAARKAYGDEDGYYPKAGGVVIGRMPGMEVKLTIEPVDGYAGQYLEHDEINAIGISNMIVDGNPLKTGNA